MIFRVGLGFDAHRFSDGQRKLKLGGIEVAGRGLVGHSDADVLLHALGDALLGAAGLGDMGTHFPDSDPQWKDADSRTFVQQIVVMLNRERWIVRNVDCVIIAEAPRLGEYRDSMRSSIAFLLNITNESVNIKATTSDQMGFTGRKEGIAAQVVVLLERV